MRRVKKFLSFLFFLFLPFSALGDIIDDIENWWKQQDSLIAQLLLEEENATNLWYSSCRDNVESECRKCVESSLKECTECLEDVQRECKSCVDECIEDCQKCIEKEGIDKCTNECNCQDKCSAECDYSQCDEECNCESNCQEECKDAEMSKDCAGVCFGETADYTAVPPFIPYAVPPNVLLVVDKSGSMRFAAYYNSIFENVLPPYCWWLESNPELVGEYDPNKTYEGYFDPHKLYEGKGKGKKWKETNKKENCELYLTCDYDGWSCICYWDVSKAKKKGKLVCSGNKLNFAYMTRMDLLRWAITGGKPSKCKEGKKLKSLKDAQKCDAEYVCNGKECELETLGIGIGDERYGKQVKVTVPYSRIKTALIPQLEAREEKPRLGLIMFASTVDEKVYIGGYPTVDDEIDEFDPSNPYLWIKAYINSVIPEGATATAPALWEAYDYFKQSDEHNYKSGFKMATSSTLYRDPHYLCDENGKNCQPYPCAQDFVILLSDGKWNTGGTGSEPPAMEGCSIYDGYENYSADPVVPSYWMHTKDLRKVEGHDIKVTAVYSVSMFMDDKQGELALENVAMYGSFDTTHGDWPDSLKGYPKNRCLACDCWDYDCQGSLCTPLPSSSPDWDANGDGVPDTFYTASNAVLLKDSLLKAIDDIMKRSSAGSSVPVFMNDPLSGSSASPCSLKGSTVIHQALFYPKKEFGDNAVSWPGYLYAWWLYVSSSVQNAREDTNKNLVLDVESDYILNWILNSYGELTIEAYGSDSKGNPTNLKKVYSSFDETSPLWEAGKKLAERSADSRKIYTVSKDGKLVEFKASRVDDFAELLGNGSMLYPDCLLKDGKPDYAKLVEYIRGEDFDGCRSRKTEDGKVWKLGDIINSSPTIENYGDFSVVFVGANDGMLHAFKVGYVKVQSDSSHPIKLQNDAADEGSSELGEELWAFIPKNVLPYLRFLADPDYKHIYLVDLRPTVFKADYDNDGEDEVVLIGGLRLGGGVGCTESECISPPSDTCSDVEDESCVGLSSYFALDVTDPTSPKLLWEFSHKDLGFSYSGPALIKKGNETIVLFGSGPTNYEGTSVKRLKFFAVRLKDGKLLEEIDGKVDSAFSGRLFTEGFDANNDGNTDYVFAGIVIQDGTEQKGGLAMIDVRDEDPDDWEVKTFFVRAIPPVTAKVEVMKCFNNYYLYFGTGKWFFKMDNPLQGMRERIYGLPLKCSGNECELITNVADVTYGTDGICNDLKNGVLRGWYLELEGNTEGYLKERVISDPTVTDKNVIIFSTTEPTADVCEYGGRSRAWILNCALGGSIADKCSEYSVSSLSGTLLLQLSGANIEEISVNWSQENGGSPLPEEGGMATAWYNGITSESAAPFISPSPTSLVGKLLLWLER
ncbi:hypothetical protein [Phorcysia thermohydrogeniphila]|uniref:Type IV pilus assembly protein PilY1 n=1 Tax=Phorcysia thermohydrogeniphila TaxID=936138 RepID=A0A4R1GEK2_9BACT|nr:hypothetical protein [Phorcysia thermohydrogeniphila]TCK06654.1 type IV pilus assembly protein PilY1 [Phorcysia thermohydrogeniphila]